MPRPVCTPPVPWPHRPHGPLRASEQARGALFRQPAAHPPLRFPASSQQKSPARLTRTNGHTRRACNAWHRNAWHRNAWHRNAWHRKSTRFPVKSISAETNPALAALCEKAAAPQTVSTGTRSLPPQNRFLVRASAPPPKRPRRPRRQRTTLPIRRESRMQSIRKTTFGRQSAAVFCSASFVKALHRHQRSQAGTARQKNGGKASSAPDTP